MELARTNVVVNFFPLLIDVPYWDYQGIRTWINAESSCALIPTLFLAKAIYFKQNSLNSDKFSHKWDLDFSDIRSIVIARPNASERM